MGSGQSMKNLTDKRKQEYDSRMNQYNSDGQTNDNEDDPLNNEDNEDPQINEDDYNVEKISKTLLEIASTIIDVKALYN